MRLITSSQKVKRYPTAVGLGSVSLLNALKMKAGGDQPVSDPTESEPLKVDKQDAHSDQVFNWPLACLPPARDNHMFGDVAQWLGLFLASVSHTLQPYNLKKSYPSANIFADIRNIRFWFLNWKNWTCLQYLQSAKPLSVYTVGMNTLTDITAYTV